MVDQRRQRRMLAAIAFRITAMGHFLLFDNGRSNPGTICFLDMLLSECEHSMKPEIPTTFQPGGLQTPVVLVQVQTEGQVGTGYQLFCLQSICKRVTTELLSTADLGRV